MLDKILLIEDSKKLAPEANKVSAEIPTMTALKHDARTKEINLGLDDPNKTAFIESELDPR